MNLYRKVEPLRTIENIVYQLLFVVVWIWPHLALVVEYLCCLVCLFTAAVLFTLALLICLQFILSNACLLLTEWWAFSFSLALLLLAHPHLNSGLLCWLSHDWNKSCVWHWQRINKADEPWRSLFIHQSWLLFSAQPASACGTVVRLLEKHGNPYESLWGDSGVIGSFIWRWIPVFAVPFI